MDKIGDEFSFSDKHFHEFCVIGEFFLNNLKGHCFSKPLNSVLDGFIHNSHAADGDFPYDLIFIEIYDLLVFQGIFPFLAEGRFSVKNFVAK